MQKQNKEMELLFTYSDVMEYVVSQCNLAMKDWDYEYIEEWLNDYEDGTIQDVVSMLVPYGYEPVAREQLRNLYKEMKAVMDDIDSLYYDIMSNSFE